MRVVINLVLFAMICGLVWVLYGSIQEPIQFNAEKQKRDKVVTDRLKAIRASQELFREITGDGYAPNFDTLIQTLKTGEIMTISVIGDKDDPDNPIISYDTTYTPATERIAELNQTSPFKIIVDSLPYVPYSKGEKFQIAADTITYQSSKGVSVLEVKTLRKNYMGKYGEPRYARYDASYDPNTFIKFGSLSAPNLTGNWE
jgi:hypothetical protein